MAIVVVMLVSSYLAVGGVATALGWSLVAGRGTVDENEDPVCGRRAHAAHWVAAAFPIDKL